MKPKLQLEIEGASTNPQLEGACQDYIDCVTEKENANNKMVAVTKIIIRELKTEKRTSLNYLGYRFTIKESEEKLVCKEVGSNG